jgi:hypothetical protein
MKIVYFLCGTIMKIEYTIPKTFPKTNMEYWLQEMDARVNEEVNKIEVQSKNIDFIHQHYEELVEEFKEFLYSNDVTLDSNAKPLKPIDVYDAINHYKIRIEKLLLILGLKIYKTYNMNKETNVKYIVMRGLWMDENGKTYRKFSRNLGSEAKVLVNGKIPQMLLDSAKDYIMSLMWDLYYFEYLDDSIAGFDSEGNLLIPNE